MSLDDDDSGGDQYLRGLQDYLKSVDRRKLELEYENSRLLKKVSELESMIEMKDGMIKEYLRRVAMLEFALRRAAGGGVLVASSVPQSNSSNSKVTVSRGGVRRVEERIKSYLEELGDDLIFPAHEDLVGTSRYQPPIVDNSVDKIAARSSSVHTGRAGSLPIKEFDLETTMHASLFSVNGICSSGDESLITVSDDGLVKYWSSRSITSQTAISSANLVLRGHKGPVRSCSSRDSTIVTGGDDGRVIAWRVNTKSKFEMYPSTDDLRRLVRQSALVNAHSGKRVMDTQIHPDIPVIATCGEDSVVSVWRTSSDNEAGEFFPIHDDETGKPVHISFDPLHSIPQCLHWYTPDRNKLVAGLADGTIALFDVATEKFVTCIRPPSQVTDKITSVSTIKESLVVSYDGCVRMIDFGSPNANKILVNVGELVTACTSLEAVSGILTGTTNGHVQVWDIRNASLPAVQTWSVDGAVSAISTLGGTRIAVASDSGDVLLYKQ
jgi:WD40 repeat protein